MSSDTFVDLAEQVQDILRTNHGGTGSERNLGYGLVEAYDNFSETSLAPGTLVSLTSGYDDRRVNKTSVLNDPNCLGPVVGTYTIYGPLTGQLEWGATSSNPYQQVAVMRMGTAQVAVGSNGVTRGHYVYAVGSNGQAYGRSDLGGGALGIWIVSNNSNTSQALIGLTAAAGAIGSKVSLNFIVDGGGAAITTGQKGHIRVDFDATIIEWSLLADTTGSITMDVWKDTYVNFAPNSGDSITASAKPSISSNSKNTSGPTGTGSLSGWTTTITAGDILAFNVDSGNTITRATLDLVLRRT
jgi:hypothetical protein